MSHPKNRRERFNVGVNKSRKRITCWGGSAEQKEIWKHYLRDTTKTCSCPMCGNPRKFFKEVTMQERKHLSEEAPMF
jgi:hypothetical protein